MSSFVRRQVLVGLDGSRCSLHALRLGAAEAALRRLPLRLVHVARVDESAGRAIIADAAARAIRRHPQLVIDVEVIRGRQPGPVLVEESARASLTVLGCRGVGGLSGSLAGSVSSYVAGRGYGPVVVVRGNRYGSSGRPVVVGVDGTATCDPAIGFAFEEAALRAVPVRAVLVWVHPPLPGLAAAVSPAGHLAAAERGAAADLETALAGWRLKYPDVPVESHLLRSRYPGRRLLAATADADLVVVGPSGGRLHGLLGGSVGHALVHHARCPVAIVHAEGAA